MPVAAVPGNVRLRAFQLGLQTTFGTAVNATRRFPWSYNPTVDPHWTFPVADTGTLDQAIAPYRAAGDYTGQATGSLAYNDAPYLWAGLTKSGVTPVANVWTFTPASTSQDSYEIFSGEWGDEVTGDQFQYDSGIVDHLILNYPENLGPVQITADWRFANVTYPHTRQSLTTDLVPTWTYAADTSYYINSTAGAIGTTKLTDTVHSATIDINGHNDVKRFQNGSNGRFQAAGYGRGARTFTATFNFAKTSAAIAEAADWLNASPVERFFSVNTIAPDIVTGATHYAHEIRFSGFWFTRTEGTYATNNTTMQLVCQGFLDSTLTYPFSAIITNGLASL